MGVRIAPWVALIFIAAIFAFAMEGKVFAHDGTAQIHVGDTIAQHSSSTHGVSHHCASGAACGVFVLAVSALIESTEPTVAFGVRPSDASRDRSERPLSPPPRIRSLT